MNDTKAPSPTQQQVVSSPTSTGGGGDQFEQHVAACSLGLLLVRAIPPILTDTSVVEVHFQTNYKGWRTDDILVTGERTDGSRRKLALQVKRTFTVSDKDEECRVTVQGMWDDFLAGDRFDPTSDQLAIAVLHGTSVLLQHFGSLLQCARAAVDAVDFGQRLSTEGYLSQKARDQHDAIRAILEENASVAVDPDRLWRFLRVVNILSYDLNTPTSQSQANLLTLLSHCAADGTEPVVAANDTWAKLLECAGEGRSIAKSYFRDDFPAELLERHSCVSANNGKAVTALVDHGRTVREGIRSHIGESYTIDRSSQVHAILTELTVNRVVIVSGIAGSGKSALAKELLNQVEPGHIVLAFKAAEFGEAHIDTVLAKSQSQLNGQQLHALLAGQTTTVVLIDAIDRLLEHSIRDAFSQLLGMVQKDRSVQLVLTVRDYSLETVRNALLAPLALPHSVHFLGALSDEELARIEDAVPGLALPLGDARLHSFLRTPYLLDLAARLQWADGAFPQSVREFRERCWAQLIRADQLSMQGLPNRRDAAFLDIAYRRATQLRPFIRRAESDFQAVDALIQDALVTRSPESKNLLAVAHDVLEDWAILKLLDRRFAETEGSKAELAEFVGGYPALRRAFRQWLSERIETAPEEARRFELETITHDTLPPYFRDDCLASALLSNSAPDFLDGCRPAIAACNFRLLERLVHTLRVACKQSPHWPNDPGLPSMMLVPSGAGWAAALRLIWDLVDQILPDHTQLVLGFLEDWAKGVNWRNPYPSGSDEAGLILDRMFTDSSSARTSDMNKRLVEVLAKIPSRVPQTRELLERARTGDYTDRLASRLWELILASRHGQASQFCRDYPDEVISLVNTRVRLSESNWKAALAYSSGTDQVEYGFGIRSTGRSNFFPPSAFQGPFLTLLFWHPQQAVDFLIDLINHAAKWYSTKRWPGRILERAIETTLEIPGEADVEQWTNPRMYCLYRGITVGPSLITSALMALESWLLSKAKKDNAYLEKWLLYVLKGSNNAMAASVVASVCVAHPEKAGRAGLALLSSREYVQSDQGRLGSEASAATGALFGLDPANFLYNQERKDANALEHRKLDLESLAVNLQLTDLREEVWALIDQHRDALPDEADEDTRIWRLALHRMDIRTYVPQDPPREAQESDDVDGRIYFGPGEPDPDIREMVDEAQRSTVIFSRHIGLLNLARQAWERDSSFDATSWRTSLLEEARALERELDEPEEFVRDGPGFAAAVSVRDHLSELNGDEIRWCAERIDREVRRSSHKIGEMDRLQQIRSADRVCASVVPLLSTVEGLQETVDKSKLLSMALTHPIEEVADYAFDGLGAFLDDEQKELILRCAAAEALKARLMSRVTRTEDEFDIVVPTVRHAIEGGALDAESELESLDFNHRTNHAGIKRALGVLRHHPSWEESLNFYCRAAVWIADAWDRERRHDIEFHERSMDLEQLAVQQVAGFVLSLPFEKALQTCSPLLDCVTDDVHNAERFVHALIMAADGNKSDCFWDLWQYIADKTLQSPWVNRLPDDGSTSHRSLNTIFLNLTWDRSVQHWHRLDGNAHLVDDLAHRLPPKTACVLAYSNFLSTIGQKSLPESFKVMGNLLEKGEGDRIASHSSIAFNLETILRNFVYSQPHRLKKDPDLRRAVLLILDVLIAAGSPAAYRMRDDFVTPSASQE